MSEDDAFVPCEEELAITRWAVRDLCWWLISNGIWQTLTEDEQAGIRASVGVALNDTVEDAADRFAEAAGEHYEKVEEWA
jgi:TRAP-type C4-dicarboxylate transport system substrate-binding protein